MCMCFFMGQSRRILCAAPWNAQMLTHRSAYSVDLSDTEVLLQAQVHAHMCKCTRTHASHFRQAHGPSPAKALPLSPQAAGHNNRKEHPASVPRQVLHSKVLAAVAVWVGGLRGPKG